MVAYDHTDSGVRCDERRRQRWVGLGLNFRVARRSEMFVTSSGMEEAFWVVVLGALGCMWWKNKVSCRRWRGHLQFISSSSSQG